MSVQPTARHLIASACLWALACGGGSTEQPAAEAAPPSDEAPALATACPGELPAPSPLPNTTAEHTRLSYWLDRGGDALDTVLLTPAEIEAQNRAMAADADNGLPIDRSSLLSAPAPDRLAREVTERLAYMRGKIEAGEYVDAEGAALSLSDRAAFDDLPLQPQAELRVALEEAPLRCGPRAEGLYKVPVDAAFDRNNCSTVRPQELVQVLQSWPNGMRLARTRYSLGWLSPTATLSPPLSTEAAATFAAGGRVWVPPDTQLRADDGAETAVLASALLPSNDAGEVLFASPAGVHSATASASAEAPRPLTRRAVLEEVFRRIGRPYGWGGHAGGIDCSRFVMDVLGSFGLELPRHSGRQAASGTYTISLEGVEDREERLRLLDAAAAQGLVLLHFPGHIMLYLGRDAADVPMVAHSFSEYLEPCEEGEGETLRRVDRVTVSDLSLGEGSTRTAFLERITSIVVFGQRAGTGLAALAQPRATTPALPPPARECDDSLDVRIFRSPERPHPGQPLRVFVTAQREMGPMEITLMDPAGEAHRPTTHRLGGPPFTYWAEVQRPRAGRWRVLLGDGPNVAACERITVTRNPREPETVDPENVWTPRFRWEADTETLYSAFVEQLFNFPIDEDRTWPNLSELLEDREHNLLFNHFGLNEESEVPLQPDCADLPYFLRTYFAWKMRLPFAFRTCTRGRHGRLPTCAEELRTPQWVHEELDPVRAFRRFILTQVKRGVHSASGRTHPEDDLTPFYPVPLTREALRPGTVYADPYGHLLIVAQWLPQGSDGYGILVGADAQPDGTVGRRRFWRGSFLFDSDTTHVGAGFKGWRPIVYDRREETYRALPNAEITARAGHTPFSMQQYEGSVDDFYERMEGLINPRALDPIQVQTSLIDALDEAVSRRVVSVDNGEEWVSRNPGRVMEMPEGGAIFQTGGPWEEYSTPSRDMRLLIAMDTVRGFPEVVRRNPARFGVSESSVDAAVERVRSFQGEELRRRPLAYTRSDGAVQRLTLADVLERAEGFEMSYNPNDCVETRWAAPTGSEEIQSCRRRAPNEQRARMDSYRSWFATRRRPLY